jgi:hypothetical protein
MKAAHALLTLVLGLTVGVVWLAVLGYQFSVISSRLSVNRRPTTDDR